MQMNTLCELLERNAALYPDQLAAICEGSSRTYGELLERARRLGGALHRIGACSQDRISMLSMNSIEYFEFYAACQVSGFVAATINFRLSEAEVEFILTDSAPRILIFEAQYAQLVNNLRPRLSTVLAYVCIGATLDWAHSYEELLASSDAESTSYRPGPDDYSSLVYTSGTTGRPKGVIKTQQGELTRAQLFAMLDIRAGGRMLLMMPMFHVGSGSMYMAQQWSAGTVYLHRRFDPPDILKTIEAERITITHMAPTMLQAVLDVPDIRQYDLSSLETLCYTAAPISVALLKRGLELLGPIFVNSWGMTETNGTVMFKHQHRPDGSSKDLKRLASVGQALPGVRLRIVDDDDRELPANSPGELIAQSPTQFACYWNNSAATLEAMRNGWMHTGDIACMDEEGFVFLLDRKSDMIISGGENIYCQEVEQALSQHPAIEDVAVIGVPDDYWGEAVKAIAVCKSGEVVLEGALIAFCGGLIASYKKPKNIVFVDGLPRVASGKVDKVALRERYRS